MHLSTVRTDATQLAYILTILGIFSHYIQLIYIESNLFLNMEIL